MTRRQRLAAVVVMMAVAQASCRTVTQAYELTRDDYATARLALHHANPAEALAAYPPAAPEGFITTLEKGWLAVLAGRQAHPALIALAQDLESRQTTRVSEELGKFVLIETSDHYFPSDHEVVALHLVAAMSLLRAGDKEGARVEARRAARALQSNVKSGLGDFDDPFLRVWLASLWTAADDWESARVDLRVAAKLTSDKQARDTWLRWADSPRPPEEWDLVFAGAGPVARWRPSPRLDLDGGLNNVAFDFTPLPVGVELMPDTTDPVRPVLVKVHAHPWYERHQERDAIVRRELKATRELANTSGAGAVAAGGYGVVYGTTLALALLSVGAGAAIAYYSLGNASGGSGLIGLILGSTVASAGLGATYETHKKMMDAHDRFVEREMDPSLRYPYVRFLPEVLYSAAGNGAPVAQARMAASSDASRAPSVGGSPAFLVVSGKSSTVRFFHVGGRSSGMGDTLASTRVKGQLASETLAVGARAWESPNGASWVSDGVPRSYFAAKAHCEGLGAGGQASYTLPTIRQLKEAAKDGMMAEAAFAPSLAKAARVWLARETKETHAGCFAYSFASMAPESDHDCEETWPSLCVSAR